MSTEQTYLDKQYMQLVTFCTNDAYLIILYGDIKVLEGASY